MTRSQSRLESQKDNRSGGLSEPHHPYLGSNGAALATFPWNVLQGKLNVRDSGQGSSRRSPKPLAFAEHQPLKICLQVEAKPSNQLPPASGQQAASYHVCRVTGKCRGVFLMQRFLQILYSLDLGLTRDAGRWQKPALHLRIPGLGPGTTLRPSTGTSSSQNVSLQHAWVPPDSRPDWSPLDPLTNSFTAIIQDNYTHLT